MNCLEFRRHLASDPRARQVDFIAHREQCGRCAEAQARALAFEDRLGRSLAVPVPEGLSDRVLLRQSTVALRERRQGHRATAWRIAAVLALGIGVGSLWVVSAPVQALPALAVGHLSHEPHALKATATVSLSELRARFAAREVGLVDDPGPVNYLNPCRLGRQSALHMVVQTADGPVTVYYVVGRVEPDRSNWQRDGLMGRSVPARDGTLVLLASSDRAFDALERNWIRALGAA
jgi:hypothetical protein